ncbi:Phosphatidylinositol glycan class T [Paragonimus heterotremus]|uniref:Phosphatidylinositol glycan class T n=1 Tax=Paragonimus heterotremus TaxID=100268 RepID=A0A8J4WHE9_9TREM|nr:Phosphatidylinositol glycan class T [Paragonimus heterotremus]
MWLAGLLFTFMLSGIKTQERFTEEMLIKDLGRGFSSFHFNFVSQSPEYEIPKQHYDIIPKSMFSLLSSYSLEELHLSMVRGYWDNERWGPNFITAAPVGAEVWSWFKRGIVNVDQAWFELTHALSGQFCASLNRLSDKAYSVSPKWSFRPTGISKLTDTTNTSTLLRYAQMPGEGLCSENFTPWVKLLPCKNLKGLSTLLIPTSLFRSNYNALTLGLRRICWDVTCSVIGLELVQTLTVVFDRQLLYGSTNVPWSVHGLLGSTVEGSCSAAHSSQIFVLRGPVSTKLTEFPTQDDRYNVNASTGDSRIQAVFASVDVSTGNGKRMMVSPVLTDNKITEALPLMSVQKYLTGSGTSDGGIRTLLISRADFTLTAVYMDMIPWYTQVLFSTLSIHMREESSDDWKIVKPVKSHLLPSLSRQRMGLMELVLSIPARHHVAISYQFRRVLQRWSEYPPDANHGYFLPAATVSYQIPRSELTRLQQRLPAAYRELVLPNWASTYAEYFNNSPVGAPHRPGDGFVRVHSAVVLISMPTPDFSMPFNTLCIVCSVIALLFGSVHKVTAGQLVAVLPNEGGPKLVRVARKIIQRLRALGGKGKCVEPVAEPMTKVKDE